MEQLLPDREYYRIGEVAAVTGVESHVLRYWEKEFPQVRPRRTPSGQRLYRRADMELFLRIRLLLHEKGYTIAGARNILDGAEEGPRAASLGNAVASSASATDPRPWLQELRHGLEEILAITGKKSNDDRAR